MAGLGTRGNHYPNGEGYPCDTWQVPLGYADLEEGIACLGGMEEACDFQRLHQPYSALVLVSQFCSIDLLPNICNHDLIYRVPVTLPVISILNVNYPKFLDFIMHD